MILNANLVHDQQPLDIFRERKERMRLVAFAPSLALMIVGVFSLAYPSLQPRLITKLTTISDIYISAFISGIWLIVISNLPKLKIVEKTYRNNSSWFRFLFDLPVLIVCLAWCIWSFYICDAFEKAFLLNIYALFVYSASRMVKIPLYAFGTNAIGLLFCVLTVMYWDYIFTQTTKPQIFNLISVIETFSSLHLGLHFIRIQGWLVLVIKKIFCVMSKLFDGVYKDDDQCNNS